MKFLKLKNKLILAPMAGVTDLAFRILCRKYGACLAYTEMVSAESLIRDNKKTKQLTQTNKDDKPLGIQLFGNNPKSLLKAAKLLEKKADLIDLNLGCPAQKLTNQNMGSALLKDKNKIKEIVTTLTKLKIPITVKIRSGYSKKNYLKIAKICEQAGACALTIHPRTAKQNYSNKADWNIIKEIKQNIKIPIIGNGDISKPEDVKEMLKTKCDYIMIGRAAICNPFIFKQSLDYLKNGKYKQTTKEDKLKALKDYLKLSQKHNISFFNTKQHAIWFTSGIKGSRKIRVELGQSKNIKELNQILKKLK